MRLHSLLSVCLAALLLAACNDDPDNTWQGYAEGDYVRVAAIEGGIVEEVAVKRGDRVKAGTFLFRLEKRSEELARDAAMATLAETKATLHEAELELKRKLELRSARNVAQAELDTARARRDRAGAAMLVAASSLDQAKWRLARREGRAPADALVQDVLFREGETAAPGQAVVTLLPPGNIKVRFFVPEADLAKLAEGRAVRLTCSNCAEGLTGTIRFISKEAEFTPPVIYSDRSKEKLVYMVEAVPDATPENFHPGQPVTVSLLPTAPE
ncbi:MAG: efflux RND transporter periplasmic adaptor subunit [Parvibaculaceae bacterium]|nr:efflux RND transporter periplasmic adaptor subunit [Parvibaculaceae bacterium]